jgi:hypothetical protein
MNEDCEFAVDGYMSAQQSPACTLRYSFIALRQAIGTIGAIGAIGVIEVIENVEFSGGSIEWKVNRPTE